MHRPIRTAVSLPLWAAVASTLACTVRPEGACLEPLRTPRVAAPCPPSASGATDRARELALLGFSEDPNARPAVELTLAGADEARLGEPFAFRLLVHNAGDGAARDLIVLVSLSEALRAPRPTSVLELSLPRLAPGESAYLVETLVAEAVGEQRFEAVASTASGELFGPVRGVLRITAEQAGPIEAQISVAAPRALPATLPASVATERAPARAANAAPRVLSLPIGWRETAPPVGDTPPCAAPAPETAATREACASPAGSSSPTSPSEPNPATRTSAPLQASDPTPQLAFNATSHAGVLELTLEGKNAPVIAGDLAHVRVHLANQSEETLHDLRLALALGPMFELVACSGATNGSAWDSSIAIDPLAKLEPGARATWKLVLRSRDPGDHVLEARLSDRSGEVLASAGGRTRYVLLD